MSSIIRELGNSRARPALSSCFSGRRRGAVTASTYTWERSCLGQHGFIARCFGTSWLSVFRAGASVVGGEMEGVGLLAASAAADPVWCVVKGISDFADKKRDTVIEENIPIACRNAAAFVLSALLNDAER